MPNRADESSLPVRAMVRQLWMHCADKRSSSAHAGVSVFPAIAAIAMQQGRCVCAPAVRLLGCGVEKAAAWGMPQPWPAGCQLRRVVVCACISLRCRVGRECRHQTRV